MTNYTSGVCYWSPSVAWWVVGSIPHDEPIVNFSFQPVLHDLCVKGCGMCHPDCLMVHIKDPLLLIRKSRSCYINGPLPYVQHHITVPKMSLCVCVWGGGGGRGQNYLRAHIHWRFRHAHHETKDWLPGLGSRGRRTKNELNNRFPSFRSEM